MNIQKTSLRVKISLGIYLNNARMPRLLEVGDELHSLGILLYLLIFMCLLVNLGLLCVVF